MNRIDQPTTRSARLVCLALLFGLIGRGAAAEPYTPEAPPRPRVLTRIPYMDSSALIQLQCTGVSPTGVMNFKVKVDDWRRFDELVADTSQAEISPKANRLGAVFGVQCSDPALQVIANDVWPLIAFVPNDAARIGDRWTKRRSLKINPVRLGDPGPVRSVMTEMCYAGDEQVNGRDCRVLVTWAAAWLDDLNISMKDLLPKDAVSGPDAVHLELYKGRGGIYRLRCEQWVDRETGVVVRADIQSRFAAWVRDLDKPIGPTIADVDNAMCTDVGQRLWLELHAERIRRKQSRDGMPLGSSSIWPSQSFFALAQRTIAVGP